MKYHNADSKTKIGLIEQRDFLLEGNRPEALDQLTSVHVARQLTRHDRSLLNSSARSAHALGRRSSYQLSDFWFIICCLWAVERDIGFTFSTLLATHAASLCLPDLATRDLNVGGTTSCAGKGRNWLWDTAGILKYMNDRGKMTFISQDMVGQEEGHQEESRQSHQSHDWCWSASEVHSPC